MKPLSVYVAGGLLVISSLALLAAAQDEGEAVAELNAETKKSSVIVIEPVVYHLRFASAFLASISMIIVSEFGDKTFFIAAIMAMRNSRLEVFASAIAALALMTVLSAAMGQTLPAILDPKLTHYMATALFFFFGAKLLYDAYQMDGAGDLKEELEEVEEELQAKELAGEESPGVELLPGGQQAAALKSRTALGRANAFARKFFSKVFIQCFTMTFLAEWGDRSQIATIALAAQKDAFGVTAGGIIGHALCTGVAVLGGKLLATRISERTILLSGGFLFLVFGLHSIYFGEEH
jgi:putative Ca2+/H+ antiporter (TMEM165/GDT1 family)